MGEEELDLGKPQLYLYGEELKEAGEKPVSINGMSYGTTPLCEMNFKIPIRLTSEKKMLKEDCICWARYLNCWIDLRCIGSKLPRKKKKWCKKEIAKVLSGAYPCRHILKYIKAKKQ